MAELAVMAVGMAGDYMAGRAEKKAAISDAKQLQYRAGQTRASAQRAAGEERRDARYLSSRARAVAAASGAGASDPTVVNLLADIEAEGEYNALARMYEGEESARGDQYAARARRSEGNAAMNAAYFGMVGRAGSTFATKYGGPKATNYSTGNMGGLDDIPIYRKRIPG